MGIQGRYTRPYYAFDGDMDFIHDPYLLHWLYGPRQINTEVHGLFKPLQFLYADVGNVK